MSGARAIIVISMAAFACAGALAHAAELADVIAWIDCEECKSEDLGVQFSRSDGALLAGIVINGPPAQVRLMQKKHLEDAYEEMVLYNKTHPEEQLPLSKEEYIDLYSDSFVALYQYRAFQILKHVDPAAAKKAIEKALKSPELEEELGNKFREQLNSL